MRKENVVLLFIGIFTFSTLLLSGCGNTEQNSDKSAPVEQMKNDGEHHHDKSGEDHSMHHTNMQMDTSSVQVPRSVFATGILKSYLEISKALSVDDDAGASVAAKKMFEAINKVVISTIPDKQKDDVKEILDNLKENADHISKNKGNIHHQREHLSELFPDLNDLIKIGGSDRVLYEIYCPMANAGQGGMWLSESNTIKNPFMGSKMGNCGTVKTVIYPR